MDRDHRWHGIMSQEQPHIGLQEYAGYYSLAGDFLELTEEKWLEKLSEGCNNIGRSLKDLKEMLGEECLDWEIAFELRLKRSRYIRIYADVLIITDNRVFSLEFKMKDRIDPKEVLQAAKYCPYLEIMFGPEYEVIPVLVLTAAHEYFNFAQIGNSDAILPVCSGDMLFNVFDEYMGFLEHNV